MTTVRRTDRPGRHVLENGPRPSLRRRMRLGINVLTPASIAATAAAILLGVVAAVGGAAGSFAYLNASAPTTAGSTITAGTASLTVQQGSGAAGSTLVLPTATWNKMLPGDFVGQSVTINNTGDAKMNITGALSAAVAWEFRVSAGACPATQLTSAALTTTASTIATIDAASSATVCLQATLPTTAANSLQGTTPAFTINVNGVQTT